MLHFIILRSYRWPVLLACVISQDCIILRHHHFRPPIRPLIWLSAESRMCLFLRFRPNFFGCRIFGAPLIWTVNIFSHSNIKFFTSHNFVSLVTPEGLTNSWNNHYPPVRFLCNRSLFTTPVIRTDLSYDLATGGILVRRLRVRSRCYGF